MAADQLLKSTEVFTFCQLDELDIRSFMRGVHRFNNSPGFLALIPDGEKIEGFFSRRTSEQGCHLLIFEGPHKPCTQAKGLGLQRDVLPHVADLNEGIADSPLSSLA